jgi:hypothetical protein
MDVSWTGTGMLDMLYVELNPTFAPLLFSEFLVAHISEGIPPFLF